MGFVRKIMRFVCKNVAFVRKIVGFVCTEYNSDDYFLIVVLFDCFRLFLIVWVSHVQPCQSSLIMIMKAPIFSFC